MLTEPLITLLATRTNVGRWANDYFAQLDQALVEAGFTLVDLEWERFEVLARDPDHFTAKGFGAFRADLGRALTRTGGSGAMTVVSDSTIDHLNRDDPTRPADAAVVRSLSRHGVNATVITRGGSGFLARRDERQDFVSLAEGVVLRARPTAWLFIGGWNDHGAGYTVQQVRAAADRLVVVARGDDDGARMAMPCDGATARRAPAPCDESAAAKKGRRVSGRGRGEREATTGG